MTDEDQQDSNREQTEARNIIFVRGFLVRFLLGGTPIGLIAVLRTELRAIMALTFAWFFVICIIGAAMDVKFKRKVSFKLNQIRLTPKNVTLIILLIGPMVYLILKP